MYAASPATWGLAIEVPDRRADAVSLSMPTEVTSTPAAKMSTSGPKFEKDARRSLAASMAPTAKALGAEPGEVLPVSCCRPLH